MGICVPPQGVLCDSSVYPPGFSYLHLNFRLESMIPFDLEEDKRWVNGRSQSDNSMMDHESLVNEPDDIRCGKQWL